MKIKKILLVVLLSLSLLACNNDGNDSSVDVKERETTEALVIVEPGAFSNVAFKCFDSVGIYVTTGGVAVLDNDPHCEKEQR